MSEGRKDDGGKLRMDLLSPEAIRGIAEVLTYGAAKYEDRNWEAGIKWSRVYSALLRHLVDAWWAGEDFDEESGLHHLDHAACCLHFLQTYRHTRPGYDDRPIYSKKIIKTIQNLDMEEVGRMAAQKVAENFRDIKSGETVRIPLSDIQGDEG